MLREMRRAKANYSIMQDIYDEALVIKDIGPWEQHPTITNDAENVVADLHCEGRLPLGRRLFYYDSEGGFSEILVQDGKFSGFHCSGE